MTNLFLSKSPNPDTYARKENECFLHLFPNFELKDNCSSKNLECIRRSEQICNWSQGQAGLVSPSSYSPRDGGGILARPPPPAGS